MQVIRDGIMLCSDCMFIAVNGDASGLDYHYGSEWRCLTCSREGRGNAPAACPFCTSEADENHGPRSKAADRLAEIVAGLEKLGPNLVPSVDSEDEEFSCRACDCCETRLAGARHEFAVLGEETE